MAHTHDKRSLETIPVGSLGVIALDGCRELAERVDDYFHKEFINKGPYDDNKGAKTDEKNNNNNNDKKKKKKKEFTVY